MLKINCILHHMGMNPFDEASSAILGDFIPVSTSAHLDCSGMHTDVGSHIHSAQVNAQMDRPTYK